MRIFTFDYETNSLDTLNPQFVIVAYKIDDEPTKVTTNIEDIRPYLESAEYLKIAHNIGFELAVSKSLGINMVPPYADSMILAWILNCGVEKADGITSYKLKELEKLWLGIERDDFKTMAKKYPQYTLTGALKKNGEPKKKKVPTLASNIPEQVLSEYCQADVNGTFSLYNLFKDKMNDKDKIVNDREMKLIPIYEDMERNGVLMDNVYLQQYERTIDKKLEAIENELSPAKEVNTDDRPNTEPVVERRLSENYERFTF